MRVNDLSKVALDSATAGIEPAISSTVLRPNHSATETSRLQSSANGAVWQWQSKAVQIRVHNN